MLREGECVKEVEEVKDVRPSNVGSKIGLISMNTAMAATSISAVTGFVSVVSSSYASTSAMTTQTTNSNALSQSNTSIGGRQSPQLFWIMLNNYQMIEAFLLLEANLHESLVEMLSSISYATFNFNFIKIPFVESLKDTIDDKTKIREELSVENRLHAAGFEHAFFIVNYLYFFILLILLVIVHLIFFIFITPPKDPDSHIQKLLKLLHRFFTFTSYLRLFFEVHFFMTI